MDVLQEFSRYLQAQDPSLPAQRVLTSWLWERLSKGPETLADKIIHHEISLDAESQTLNAVGNQPKSDGNQYPFTANSPSGQRLLNSLYQYSLSYEYQKWVRFIHQLRASDFNKTK